MCTDPDTTVQCHSTVDGRAQCVFLKYLIYLPPRSRIRPARFIPCAATPRFRCVSCDPICGDLVHAFRAAGQSSVTPSCPPSPGTSRSINAAWTERQLSGGAENMRCSSSRSGRQHRSRSRNRTLPQYRRPVGARCAAPAVAPLQYPATRYSIRAFGRNIAKLLLRDDRFRATTLRHLDAP